MILNQYHLGSLALSSYLIGDLGSARAVVVDPGHDIAQYLDDAARHRLKIIGIIETHVHEDFIAGTRELAAATGAWIGLGARAVADYEFRRLHHGEKIPLGEVELEIHETPGHCWESITVLVRAHATDRIPRAALTGDTLFIGDVGRPDLAAAIGADPVELTRALYHSVHEDLMRLDDAVQLLPAHAAWPALGLASGVRHTIGEQRRTNPAVQPMSEDDFVALVAAGRAPDGSGTRPLDAAALKTALATGARILDARPPKLFNYAHIVGSVNVGLDAWFEQTAQALFGRREQIVIVAEFGSEAEARRRLLRAGFGNLLGHVPDLAEVFAALPRAQARTERLPADQLGAAVADTGTVILDVRSPAERERRFMPGTLHFALAELTHRHSQLPAGRRIVVQDTGDWRASAAASALRALGHPDVIDVARD